jgi:hypothetical protein
VKRRAARQRNNPNQEGGWSPEEDAHQEKLHKKLCDVHILDVGFRVAAKVVINVLEIPKYQKCWQTKHARQRESPMEDRRCSIVFHRQASETTLSSYIHWQNAGRDENQTAK